MSAVDQREEMRQQMMERKKRKVRIGTVISHGMDKSIVVSVKRLVRHPLYERVIRRTSTLVAHDAGNTCRVGDRVKVMETRPLSKTKHWRLVEILERASEGGVGERSV